jgi:hypothetical protein
VSDDNPVDALDIEEQEQQQVNDNLSEQVDVNDDAIENISFGLHCCSIIVKHVKLKIYYWICFRFARKISTYVYYIRFIYSIEGPS